MRSRSHLVSPALAALLLCTAPLTTLAQSAAAPKPAAPAAKPAAPAAAPAAGQEAPCAPVKPCDIGEAGAADTAEQPADFGPQVRELFALVSCQGAPPPGYDGKVVAAFCAKQKKAIAAYRDGYLPRASAFLAKLRPAGLPTTVVYPFGGGDLLSALTTYPDAKNITTLSLEHAGDPRRLDRLKDPKKLAESLEVIRATSNGLLYANDSKTENLMKGQRGEIPGQLAFFLTALAVHGYEPVGLRYFRIEPDGSIHYLTMSDIAAVEKQQAKLLRGMWTAPDFSAAFSNAELTFVKKGEDAETKVRIHRHIAADLSDGALKKDPGPVEHLKKKGTFAAMTKAASYLLWRPDFSRVRNVLLSNMVFMISDSTGIPPRWAKKAGFVQETYGTYEKAFLEVNPELDAEMVKLWADQPHRALPIRYGYIDGSPAKQYHLMVTRKAEAPAK